MNATTAQILPWYTFTLTGLSSGLSVCGSVVFFQTFYLFPEIRNFTRRLLVYLTLADLMAALGIFAGNIRYAMVVENATVIEKKDYRSGRCIFQSFVHTSFNMASYFWTLFIAVHLWMSLERHSDVSRRKYAAVIFHSIAWGIPGTITITALGTDVLGQDFQDLGRRPWCFISGHLESTERTVWILLGSKLWGVICFISTCSICVLLIWKLHRKRNWNMHDIAPHLRNEDRIFLFAGLVMYIIKLPGYIQFLWILVDPGINQHVNAVLFNLMCALTGSQGFANCIFFCVLDKTVRTQIRARFHRQKNECNPLIYKESKQESGI